MERKGRQKIDNIDDLNKIIIINYFKPGSCYTAQAGFQCPT